MAGCWASSPSSTWRATASTTSRGGFAAGRPAMVGTIEIGGHEYPIGDLLFECGGVRIGLEICRDAWVADRTGARLAQRGADVLLNPSASHFAFAKQQIRERFVLEGSRAFCVSYAYCNLLGNEAGRSIYDGGTLIASGGKMLVRGPRFSFADWLLTTAVIDVTSTRRAKAESFPDVDPAAAELTRRTSRGRLPVSTSCRAGRQRAFTRGLAVRETMTTPSRFDIAACLDIRHGKPARIRRRKSLPARCRSRCSTTCGRATRKGFVVSLSGGADSSAVAVLVHLMVQLGGRELGCRRWPKSWPTSRALAEHDSATQAVNRCAQASRAVRRLLTCVYQSTRNSGQQTLAAAQDDCRGASAPSSSNGTSTRWSTSTSNRLAGDRPRARLGSSDDVALQNIQARARGPGIWLLANLRDALLLTTSNRSEAAVGYATMDGDTCGGLAPIAGIDKAFLLDWLKWMETTGPAGIGPLPALSVVNATAANRRAAAAGEPIRPTKPTSCRTACWTRSSGPRSATSSCRSKCFETVRPQFPQYRHCSRWRSGSSGSSACGAATSGSASGTPRRSIWMMRISTPKPGAGSRFSTAGLSENWRSCATCSQLRLMLKSLAQMLATELEGTQTRLNTRRIRSAGISSVQNRLQIAGFALRQLSSLSFKHFFHRPLTSASAERHLPCRRIESACIRGSSRV